MPKNIQSDTESADLQVKCMQLQEQGTWTQSLQKWLVGGDPLYLKFWIKLTALERYRRFLIFFIARSDSAVTPSEKSSINTDRKFTTRFPVSPRWTSYVVPKPAKGVQKYLPFYMCHERWALHLL